MGGCLERKVILKGMQDCQHPNVQLADTGLHSRWVLHGLRCLRHPHCFLLGCILGWWCMLFQKRTKDSTRWCLRGLRPFRMCIYGLLCGRQGRAGPRVERSGHGGCSCRRRHHLEGLRRLGHQRPGHSRDAARGGRHAKAGEARRHGGAMCARLQRRHHAGRLRDAVRGAWQRHLRHEVRQRVHERDDVCVALLLSLGRCNCTIALTCQTRSIHSLQPALLCCQLNVMYQGSLALYSLLPGVSTPLQTRGVADWLFVE